MSDRKIFVLSNGGHDYTDATRFGELVFMNIPHSAKWDIAQVYDILLEGMKDANKDDLILISNLTSLCCVATALMVEWYGQVNFLIYRHDKYEEKKLVLNTEVITGE